MGMRSGVRNMRSGWLALGLLVAGCSAPSTSEPAEAILVMAASSLTDALTEAKEIYERENPTSSVDLSFAGSLQLRRQIERGAPADVFVSASVAHMDALDRAAIVMEGTRVDLLANRIVAATSRLDPLTDGDLGRLRDLGDRIGLAEPGVPVGDYARDSLRHLGLWEELRRRVVPLPDERAVLQAVISGAVDWGVVYRSSIDRGRGVRLSVLAELPAASHAPVVYPAAVLSRSSRPSQARRFLRFLQSETGARVFREHGFADARGE